MQLFRSVNARIYGAFGALTVIMMIIGGAALALMMNANHLFQRYQLHAEQSLAIDVQLIEVSNLSINFLNYVQHPNASWEAAVKAKVAQVMAPPAETLALFADDEAALATITEVSQIAQNFSADFDKVVAAVGRGANAATVRETAGLTRLTPRMHQFYTALSETTHNAQNELGPEISAQNQLQLAIIAVTCAIGLIVGILLAAINGRWLAGTFRRLTGTMRELAGGNYAMTVPDTTRQNELGEMARALETFRINGQQVAQAEIDKQAHTDEIAARAAMMLRFQKAFDTVIAQAINGDFSGRIDERFGDNEIDRITDNLNGMLGSIEAALAEADRVLGAMAEADLRDRMTGSYQGAFAKLKTSTNSVADKLEEIMTGLRDTSRSLKQATGEILAGANDLSERSTKQASTIQQTSSAMDQLAKTVALNAERAQGASATAVRMTGVVEAGSQVMGQATDAMGRISTSSTKISNIIGLIDDIAFQTNLLALNASVEAARAGEAGKGFAVVAVEVRRLAQSAAKASSDVKELIEESSQEVRTGSRLVTDVAGRLAEIIEGTRQTATLMESIATDSRAQAAGIGEVNIAVRQMDEMTQHNAALVEEMNASIEQTESQATRLDGIAETFTLNEHGHVATPVEKPAARPTERTDARGMLAKVRQATQTYFGNTATAQNWDEF